MFIKRLIKEQMSSILSARIDTKSELGILPQIKTRTQTIKPQIIQTRQPVFNLLNQELEKTRFVRPTTIRTSQSLNLGLDTAQVQPQILNQKQLQKQDLGLKQLQINPIIKKKKEHF